MNALLDALARWYFRRYLRPLIDTYLAEQRAAQQAEPPKPKRFIGE